MRPDKKAAFCEALIPMRGKAVHIIKENGDELEGIVMSAEPEGLGLISLSGPETIPYEEIAACDSFGVVLLEAEKPEVREGEALLAEVENGTKASFLEKLTKPSFYKEAGLSREEAEEIRARTQKHTYPWKSEPLAVAIRYSTLLKEKARPELTVGLYIRALESDEPRKDKAVLELLRAYMRMQAYEKVIEAYEKYESLLGEAPYAHMQSYAAAIGYVQGEVALSAFLEAHPALLDYSTNRLFFDKLIRTLREKKEIEVVASLLKSTPKVQPNAFEAAVLSGNIHRARQLAANVAEMQKMGYARPHEIEAMLLEESVADMGKKLPWQRACILVYLEGNRGRVAERALLEAGEESGARAALLLLYAKEKAHDKVLCLYQNMEDAAFDQKCAAFIAYNTLGEIWKAEEILEAAPEMFADPDVRLAILAAGDAYGEEAEAIAREVEEKASPKEGQNPLEKALIKGNVAEITAISEDAAALSSYGYTEAEIRHIGKAATKPYPDLKNDFSAARRLHAFLGGRGLLALSYLCRYATEQNTGEILSLMHLSGLSVWGIRFFEARREVAEGQSAACAAYASMLLATRPLEEAIREIEPFIHCIYDRELLEKVRAGLPETGRDALAARIDEILDAYEPNAFEKAVIGAHGYKQMGKDAELLLSLGYTEEEVKSIARVCDNAPKGESEADIGRRLYHIQGNKNGLAERYLAPHACEGIGMAEPMFHIYVGSGRYKEAMELYNQAKDILAPYETQIHKEHLSALYFTGAAEEFIALYENEGGGRGVHLPMYAEALLKTGNAKFSEVLSALAIVTYQSAEKVVWENLCMLLSEKEMYKELGILLCGFFRTAVRGGTYADLFPLLEKCAGDDKTKDAIIEAAISEGLPMFLPVFWIMHKEEHPQREAAENWCADQLLSLQEAVSVTEPVYAFLEMLFPQKKTDIQEGKFLQLLGGEGPHTGAAAFLTKLFTDGEHLLLERMLPHLGAKAASPLILAALSQIFHGGVLCDEIVLLLSAYIKEAPEAICGFFTDNVDMASYQEKIPEENLAEMYEAYRQYALSAGTETAHRTMYAFLSDTNHPDAPILASVILQNSHIWQSTETRAAFESLYREKYGKAGKSVLSATFAALLAGENPEKVYTFLQKWHPFINWKPHEVLKMLGRARGEGESDETVCSMAVVYKEEAAWRRLLEMYRHKGVGTEGTIYYLIAKCSSDPDDLKIAYGFAGKNGLYTLQTYASVLGAGKGRADAQLVWRWAQNITRFAKSGAEVSKELFAYAVDTARAVFGSNPEAIAILHAVRALAFAGNYIREYTEGLSDALSKKPNILIALLLEVLLHAPEEEIIEELIRLLEEKVPDTIPFKAFALYAAAKRATLSEEPALLAAVRTIAPTGHSLTVSGVQHFVAEAVTAEAENSVEVALGALSVLHTYFENDGLLHEAEYFLLGAAGADEARAEDCYRALTKYLQYAKIVDAGVLVRYSECMYCGIRYLTKKGLSFGDGPKNTEELLAFFAGLCEEEAARAELSQFIRRTEMLGSAAEIYDTLMLCGLFGSWRKFIETVDTALLPEHEILEIDSFIGSVGRENFLNAAATTEKWRNVRDFLTESKAVACEAAVEAAQTAEARQKAANYARFMLLDEKSGKILANKIFARITPDIFGEIFPMLRILLRDDTLLDKLSKMPAEFWSAASASVLRQKDTVPALLQQAEYRAFLKALSEKMFNAGMYKEASPVFAVRFSSDNVTGKSPKENAEHAKVRQYTKICDLMCRVPEEVERVRTSTEHQKLINIFSVFFSTPCVKELPRLAALLTKLQKKLCVAVYFAMRGEFEDFELLAADIQAENAAMGETLFRFGEFRFREGDRKERCRKYIQKLQGENGEEMRLFFLYMPATEILSHFRIFDMIDLENDGEEAFTVRPDATVEAAAPEKSDSEAFLSLSYVQYILSMAAGTPGAPSAQEAMERFEEEAGIENAVAALKAPDFKEVSASAMQEFFADFAICAYQTILASDAEETEAFAAEIFRTLSVVSAISAEMANILCESLAIQLASFENLSDIRACLGKNGEKLMKLLSAADREDIKVLRLAMKLYIDTVGKLSDIRSYWDEGRKIKETEKYLARLETEGEKLADEAAGDILGNLAYILESEIEDLKRVPLFRLHLDETEVPEGLSLTGFVENYGQAVGKDVTLLLRTLDGDSATFWMETFHGGWKAPFAFRLPPRAPGEEVSFTAQITYTFSDDGKGGEASRRKSLGAHAVRIVPRVVYEADPIGDATISVENIETDFIGRFTEVQGFKNVFYLHKDIDGQMQKVPRPPEKVDAMVINGPKRVGKSSLLHYLEKIVLEIPDKWVCVYFDPMGNKTIEDIFIGGFVNAWEKRYGAVSESEAYRRILEKLPSGKFSATTMENFYRAFRDTFAPGRKILFIIDEFEKAMRLVDPGTVFDLLQHATKNHRDLISFAVCGSDDLAGYIFDREHDTQFFSLAKLFRVGLMPREEYDLLLAAYQKLTKLTLDAQAREALWQLTRGQVYYTQRIFDKIVDNYGVHPISGARNQIHLYDVYWAFGQLRKEGTMFIDIVGMFDKYKSGEREVMEALSTYATAPGACVSLGLIQRKAGNVDVDMALSRLTMRGFVERVGEDYRFTSEIYRMVFADYAPEAFYFIENGGN